MRGSLHGVFRTRLDAPLRLLPQPHQVQLLHAVVVELFIHLVAKLLELDGQIAVIVHVEQIHQFSRDIPRTDAVLAHEESLQVLSCLQVTLYQGIVFLIKFDVHLANPLLSLD